MEDRVNARTPSRMRHQRNNKGISVDIAPFRNYISMYRVHICWGWQTGYPTQRENSRDMGELQNKSKQRKRYDRFVCVFFLGTLLSSHTNIGLYCIRKSAFFHSLNIYYGNTHKNRKHNLPAYAMVYEMIPLIYDWYSCLDRRHKYNSRNNAPWTRTPTVADRFRRLVRHI